MMEIDSVACFPSPPRESAGLISRLLVFASLCFLASTMANASESLSNLQPVSDTYIAENTPNSNFGNNRFGLLGDIGGDNILLLKYDLTAIPPGSTVVTATLSFQKAFTDHSGPMTVELRRRREAWNESTTTWNNVAPLNDPLYGSASLNTDLSFPVITDGPLKMLVQEWIDQPTSNHGLAIGPASLTGTYISFHMREDLPAGQPIRLSVSFEPPGPTPPNLLSNPSFEEGTTGWTCNGCTHVREFGIVAHGQESALINSRSAAWAGPTQTITQLLVNGETYSVSGLVRTTLSQGSIARFTFYLNTTAGVQYVSSPEANVFATHFTQVSGNVPLQWSGTLVDARVYVETSGDNASFYLDEVRLTPQSTTPTNHTLSVSKTGSGTVTSSPSGINCGTDCTESYGAGTVVSLSASPAAGSTFAGWSGACTGTGSCQVTMDAAKAVSAAFSAPANLLSNPSFEQGTTGWTCNNCTLSSESVIVAEGQKSARISGRAASWAGPAQTITQAVTNGKTYSISGFVRTTRPEGSTARFTFYLNRSPGGALYIPGPQATVSNGQFTQISGNVTLQWSGSLLDARVYVETVGDAADFYLDNVALSELP